MVQLLRIESLTCLKMNFQMIFLKELWLEACHLPEMEEDQLEVLLDHLKKYLLAVK